MTGTGNAAPIRQRGKQQHKRLRFLKLFIYLFILPILNHCPIFFLMNNENSPKRKIGRKIVSKVPQSAINCPIWQPWVDGRCHSAHPFHWTRFSTFSICCLPFLNGLPQNTISQQVFPAFLWHSAESASVTRDRSTLPLCFWLPPQALDFGIVPLSIYYFVAVRSALSSCHAIFFIIYFPLL